MTNEIELVVTAKKQFRFGIKSIPIQLLGIFVLSEIWTQNQITRFLNRIFLFKSKGFVWDLDEKTQNCIYWETWNRILRLFNKFGIFGLSDFRCKDRKKSSFSRIILCMCSSDWDFDAMIRLMFREKVDSEHPVESTLKAFFGKLGTSVFWWKYQKKKFLHQKNRCKCNTSEWKLEWGNQTCNCGEKLELCDHETSKLHIGIFGLSVPRTQDRTKWFSNQILLFKCIKIDRYPYWVNEICRFVEIRVRILRSNTNNSFFEKFGLSKNSDPRSKNHFRQQALVKRKRFPMTAWVRKWNLYSMKKLILSASSVTRKKDGTTWLFNWIPLFKCKRFDRDLNGENKNCSCGETWVRVSWTNSNYRFLEKFGLSEFLREKQNKLSGFVNKFSCTNKKFLIDTLMDEIISVLIEKIEFEKQIELS